MHLVWIIWLSYYLFKSIAGRKRGEKITWQYLIQNIGLCGLILEYCCPCKCTDCWFMLWWGELFQTNEQMCHSSKNMANNQNHQTCCRLIPLSTGKFIQQSWGYRSSCHPIKYTPCTWASACCYLQRSEQRCGEKWQDCTNACGGVAFAHDLEVSLHTPTVQIPVDHHSSHLYRTLPPSFTFIYNPHRDGGEKVE